MKLFRTSFFIVLLFFPILLQIPVPACGATEEFNKIRIRSLHPMLGMVVSFIGGVQVEINDNAGPPAQKETKPENDGAIQEFAISIDRKEAIREDMAGLDSDKIHYLYNEIPVSRDAITSLYYDPAALPFIGQKVMKALSNISPRNYPYFQRRLAEFKTRLQSTVMVGRKMLEGALLFDVTGHSMYLFQAAGCRIEMIPDDFFDKLDEEESADYYTRIFSDQQEKGAIVVGDYWTPEPVKNLMVQENLGVILPAPDNKEEIILYLHKQFLCVWDKYRQK